MGAGRRHRTCAADGSWLLEDLFNFYKGYGWDRMHDFSLIKKFASLNQYRPCKKVSYFRPGKDGFGPWYGFQQCSVSTYLNDIDHAESIYLENADFLTSSHAYVVKKTDTSPFNYMRSKISRNQIKVDQALRTMAPHIEVEEKVKRLLEMDLFFPKYKIKGFLYDIYAFWESWMIRHHIRRSND